MTTLDTVQENANDILAAAQDLNDERAAQEEAERAANDNADGHIEHVVAQWLTNPTRSHEVAGLVPALAQWVNDLALP